MQSERLSSLASTLTGRNPWCSGTITVPEHCFAIFYGKAAVSRRVDLLTSSELELADLGRACDAATFGRDQQDVLDESYRKAGKMDVGDFATTFEIGSSGGEILDAVRQGIVEERAGEDQRRVRAELYKLNIYGPGSFFKAHKDTPRAENMFGSLVLVFPTAHSGGALQLRDNGHSLVVDSGSAATAMSTPGLVYAAFYSDVEHEVAVVNTGYRVTLTYNLYFVDDGPAPAPTPALTHGAPTNEKLFRAALEALLADPTFLPQGGSIGFALRHQYPVPKNGRLTGLLTNLKGSDALVQRVCSALNLAAALKALYNDKGKFVMMNSVVDLSRHGEIEDSLSDYLRTVFPRSTRQPAANAGKMVYVDRAAVLAARQEEERAFLKSLRSGKVYDEDEDEDEDADGDEEEEEEGEDARIGKDRHELGREFRLDEEVLWATPLNTVNRVKMAYMAYGNQASLDFTYVDLALVVTIGKPGGRETVSQATEIKA